MNLMNKVDVDVGIAMMTMMLMVWAVCRTIGLDNSSISDRNSTLGTLGAAVVWWETGKRNNPEMALMVTSAPLDIQVIDHFWTPNKKVFLMSHFLFHDDDHQSERSWFNGGLKVSGDHQQWLKEAVRLSIQPCKAQSSSSLSSATLSSASSSSKIDE